MRGSIIAALMAAALAGVAGKRAFRGRGAKPGETDPGSPSRYPWDQPSRTPTPDAGSPSRYPWDQPSAAAPPTDTVRAPVAEAAPTPLEPSNPRFGEVAPEDVGGLNEAQIRDIINRAAGMPSSVETGGDVGARLGGDVYRPGIEAPAPAPGMHGSKFGQPIVRPKVKVKL
jgi:hypothetical protein